MDFLWIMQPSANNYLTTFAIQNSFYFKLLQNNAISLFFIYFLKKNYLILFSKKSWRFFDYKRDIDLVKKEKLVNERYFIYFGLK